MHVEFSIFLQASRLGAAPCRKAVQKEVNDTVNDSSTNKNEFAIVGLMHHCLEEKKKKIGC